MKKPFLLLVIALLLFQVNKNYAQSYYLIVSSFKSENAAVKKVNKLIATGFTDTDYLYFDQDKLYRIFIDKFPNRDQAEKSLNIYREKFSDAWIYVKSSDNLTEKKLDAFMMEYKAEITLYNERINEIFKYINSFDEELKEIKEEIKTGDDDQLVKVEALEQKVDVLGEALMEIDSKVNDSKASISSIQEEVDEHDEKYISKIDTIQYSWESLANRFDFGDPKVSFDIGGFQTTVTEGIDSLLLRFLNIQEDPNTNVFYGINLGLQYNISPRFNTGFDLNAYVYNANVYLFPFFKIGFSSQLGQSRIKLTPTLAVGTNITMLENTPALIGDYVFYQPGIDVALGLNEHFSIIGSYNYNFGLPISSNLNPVNYYNYNLGLQISF